MNLGKYSKFAVAVANAVTTGMETFAGASHVTQIVTVAVGALLVYLVPNSQ